MDLFVETVRLSTLAVPPTFFVVQNFAGQVTILGKTLQYRNASLSPVLQLPQIELETGQGHSTSLLHAFPRA